MLTQRQALEEARGNIACGTSIAARIKETSQNPEIRELAKAVYFIGFGSNQIQNASMRKRCFSSARRYSCCACSGLMVKGFSHRTCLPCSKQSLQFS